MSESEQQDLDRDIPVMQKATKQKRVDESGEVSGRTMADLILMSIDKIQIAIVLGVFAGILAVIWYFTDWIIPVTAAVVMIPAVIGLSKVITVPHKLVMEYKRKLQHFDLYSVPSKLFRHFDIDPRTAKLTAGSNQFVFLCSNADLENFKLDTAWPADANPFDFRIDEDAYFELAKRYEKMAEQDLANIAIPQVLGMERARENSKKLDENDFDDLPEDYSKLKKDRPTEAYDRLKDMKGVGNSD